MSDEAQHWLGVLIGTVVGTTIGTLSALWYHGFL